MCIICNKYFDRSGLPGALIECSSIFFRRDSTTARICLSLVQDISDIQKIVLEKRTNDQSRTIGWGIS